MSIYFVYELYNMNTDEFIKYSKSKPTSLLLKIANTNKKKEYLLKYYHVPLIVLYKLDNPPCRNRSSKCVCNTSSLHYSCEHIIKKYKKYFNTLYVSINNKQE